MRVRQNTFGRGVNDPLRMLQWLAFELHNRVRAIEGRMFVLL